MLLSGLKRASHIRDGICKARFKVTHNVVVDVGVDLAWRSQRDYRCNNNTYTTISWRWKIAHADDGWQQH
jgi:hypothetical protein